MAREVEALSRAGDGGEPGVVAAAIEIVAFAGGPDEYDAYVARMQEAATPQEQERYRSALARFRDPASMARTLALAASGEIRSQDAPFLLSRAESNREVGEIAWAYVRDHWDELVPRFAASNVIHLAQGARFLTEPDQVADVQALLRGARHPAESPLAVAGDGAPTTARGVAGSRRTGARRALRQLTPTIPRRPRCSRLICMS